MKDTVQKLLAPYKGILAADESTGTITKRFAALNLISSPELNKKYREMLFTAPDFEKYISGVILFDETIKQGLGEILKAKGVAVGIKVDQGLEDFGESGEKTTNGLNDLESKIEEYKKLGAEFTKWRGVIMISDITPTDKLLDETLGRMAKYAKIVQNAGMIPIVEPEVLLDGNHTTTRCEEIIVKTLKVLFEKLDLEGVNLESIILKSSMVLPGKDSGVNALPLEVANATLRAFQKSVPENLPGVVFLSGGQTPDQATDNLNEVVKLNKDKKFGSWDLSFSYSRALQNEAMETWGGKDENVDKAQNVFLERLQKVSKARMGEL